MLQNPFKYELFWHTPSLILSDESAHVLFQFFFTVSHPLYVIHHTNQKEGLGPPRGDKNMPTHQLARIPQLNPLTALSTPQIK